MKAHFISMSDVFVAGVAITLGRVGNKTRVSQLFVLVLAITAVTDNTADFAMSILKELRVLYPDLFPYLQRR
jgi:hypothetical protein